MKKLLSVLLLLAVPFATLSFADVYQWTDAQGVSHFTDNRDLIPKKYRNKALRRKMSIHPPTSPSSSPSQPSAAKASPAEPQPELFGGQPGPWWKERFVSTRKNLKALEDGLAQKQAKLVELRRKRLIYMRASDRVAINKEQAEIDADQAKVLKLQQEMSGLEAEANRAAVPAKWRQ